jgi:DNA repair protein RecO (recombination protein O)
MTSGTRAIILRKVDYGNSSLIITAYTEKFGLQAYIIKGIRTRGPAAAQKMAFFQPGSLLNMQVYHRHLNNLQFIKDQEWVEPCMATRTEVVRHLCASWCIQQVLQTITEPEPYETFFDWLWQAFLFIDRAPQEKIGNIPPWFTIHLCRFLGAQIQGSYCKETPIFDLLEGCFVPSAAGKSASVSEGIYASCISMWNRQPEAEQMDSLALSRHDRRQVLYHLQQFMQYHVPGYRLNNILDLLQEVFN